MAMIPPIMREPIGGFRSPLPNKGISYPGISPAMGGQPGGGQMIPIDASHGFRAPPIRTHAPGGFPGQPESNPGAFAGNAWGETSLPHTGQLEPMEQIRQFLANSRFHGEGIPFQGLPPRGGQMGEDAGGLGSHPLAGLIAALGGGHASPIDLDGRRPNRAHAPAFRAQ